MKYNNTHFPGNYQEKCNKIRDYLNKFDVIVELFNNGTLNYRLCQETIPVKDGDIIANAKEHLIQKVLNRIPKIPGDKDIEVKYCCGTYFIVVCGETLKSMTRCPTLEDILEVKDPFK